MIHLLNLLAAIALLVWGTHIVRTGMLRVFGENLRHVLARSFGNRLAALAAGLGVTSLVQSSAATCLIVASFVGKGLVPTAAALAVMLGADVGTAAMAVVFSFDLSWLSPLLIFSGVVLFVARQATAAGRVGRVLIGLGLITLALQLIVGATRPLTEAPAVRALLAALPNEVLLDILVGAVLTVLCYSSLAIVLLTATLAAQGLLPPGVALGLVVGANLGSGLLAIIATPAMARWCGACRWAICCSSWRVRRWPSRCCPRPCCTCSSSCRRCTSRWWASTWASTGWWRCCSSASPARWRLWWSAGCPHPRPAMATAA